ncbi:hypothetical protein [Citrobacter sp. wls710]|uniref:helix-turn-helix transcriptional regulator n=1 Tax=Citrobacter sp. wls710 TaxID=2576426 RepID=UPI0014856738|nr:hypothetical protein [Citrobacter sp. wls710]
MALIDIIANSVKISNDTKKIIIIDTFSKRMLGDICWGNYDVLILLIGSDSDIILFNNITFPITVKYLNIHTDLEILKLTLKKFFIQPLALNKTRSSPQRLDLLTGQQMKVLYLTGWGHSLTEISNIMGISTTNASAYRISALKKVRKRLSVDTLTKLRHLRLVTTSELTDDLRHDCISC